MNEVVQPEEGVLPENPAPEQPETPETPETPENPEQPAAEDYRAKLNATNRFLEKEGYEWKEGKWQKSVAPKPESPAPRQEQTVSLTRDEAVVIAKGHSLEELEQAKKVATLENCELLDALDKPLFKGWKTEQDKIAKDRQAQLGASKGGGRTSPKKTFATKGLSDDEHKELFAEKLNG